MRDTFASQLLTAGIQVGYISKQLGHRDVKVTVDHYAEWCGDKEYREPIPLMPGEVPADLLARLEPDTSFDMSWVGESAGDADGIAVTH